MTDEEYNKWFIRTIKDIREIKDAMIKALSNNKIGLNVVIDTNSNGDLKKLSKIWDAIEYFAGILENYEYKWHIEGKRTMMGQRFINLFIELPNKNKDMHEKFCHDAEMEYRRFFNE